MESALGSRYRSNLGSSWGHSFFYALSCGQLRRPYRQRLSQLSMTFEGLANKRLSAVRTRRLKRIRRTKIAKSHKWRNMRVD